MPEKSTSILIVDDDADYCRLIDKYLRKEGFHTIVAHDAEQMRQHVDVVSLVLLDLHLPRAHGLELAREIREKYASLGIIIVTASDDEIDKIVGLEVGADDYVCKPFNERELLARIRSVLRRIDLDPVNSINGMAFLDYRLDLEAHRLTRNGEEISLTGHEYNLLVTLAERSNRVFTREEISRKVSNREWYPDDRSVDVLVSKLRKKLETEGGRSVIKSLRGVGYQFATRVEKY